MGRKKKQNYFGENEEEAVVKFINSDDLIERNEIYNKHLRFPIEKMVESIIRRYRLFSKVDDYNDLHADTLSFLILKSDKFKPSENKKAYSYYGTICRNYLIYRLVKETKSTNTTIEFESYHSSDNNDISDETYEAGYDNVGIGYNDFIDHIIKTVKADIDKNINKMTENELKVGNSVLEILTNRKYFIREDSNKYNKINFYYSVREYTGLETKDIRIALKRYKSLYMLTKNNLLNDGLL